MWLFDIFKKSKTRSIKGETELILALESRKNYDAKRIKFSDSNRFIALDELCQTIQSQIKEIKKLTADISNHQSESAKSYLQLSHINYYIQLLEKQILCTKNMISSIAEKKEYTKYYDELIGLLSIEQKYKNPKELEKIGQKNVSQRLRRILKSSFFSILILLACSSSIQMQKNENNSQTKPKSNQEQVDETKNIDSTEIKVMQQFDSLRTADSLEAQRQIKDGYSASNIKKITCRFFKEDRLRPVTDTANPNPDNYFRSHLGIDYTTPDSLVKCHGNGTVTKSYQEGTSFTLEITYLSGDVGIYRHLSSTTVGLNDTVKADQIIADIKNKDTKSTGPHVHYEHIRNGQHIDPMKVLNIFDNVTIYDLPPSKYEIEKNPQHYQKIYKSQYYKGAFEGSGFG